MTLYEVWGVLRRIFKNMKEEFSLKTLMTSETKKNAQPGKMTSTTLFKQNNIFTIAAINKDGIVYNTTKSLTTAYYNQKYILKTLCMNMSHLLPI